MKQKEFKDSKLHYKDKKKVRRMWPFGNVKTQKGVSIVLLIAGIALLFSPMATIKNSFMVGVILAVLGAIYLIDLR